MSAIDTLGMHLHYQSPTHFFVRVGRSVRGSDLRQVKVARVGAGSSTWRVTEGPLDTLVCTVRSKQAAIARAGAYLMAALIRDVEATL